MLKLEGKTYDRQTSWPSSSASKSGVNGFVAIKTLEKPFSDTVLGLSINLKTGTKVLLKYVGQFKYWIQGWAGDDKSLSGKSMHPDKTEVQAEQKEKIIKILLKDLQNFLDDLDASKQSEKDKHNAGYEMLQDFSYFANDLDKMVKVANFLKKNVIKEASIQQKAATMGVAPKVYGYDENPLQWCMTMEFIKDAVYDETNENSYLDTKVITIDARKQLVALCHKLDMNGISHNDLKPDNYRMQENRLYIIDYGLSKDVGKTHYSNMNCLHWGGWTLFARYLKFGSAMLRVKPLKLQGHSKYMTYNHNTAKNNLYNVGDVVLMDEEKFYMLYQCRSNSKQNEIYFKHVKVKGKGSKREQVSFIPGTKENEDKLKLERNNNDYFKHVVKPNLGIEDYDIFTLPYNVWDRPAWKAMWIHPSIPFSLDECLEAYDKIVNKPLLKMKDLKF